MPNTNPSYIAKGTILPSVFVKMDGTNDFAVVSAGANAEVVGIAMEGSRAAPIPSEATVQAALTGENLLVYGPGDDCHLTLGGTVTPGDVLKSDASGHGVVIATSGTTIQHIGARALEGGVSGDLIRVHIEIRSERPALV